MKQKGYSNEQIVYALKQAEGGQKIAEITRQMGVSEATFYNWKKKYEGMGARKAKITGTPNHAHVLTSFIERSNLSLRMGNRRFTRLTNAFSKKVENHEHMLALFFMYYNFCRIHQSLRVTPAMAAGVSTRGWELSDVIALIDSASKAAA